MACTCGERGADGPAVGADARCRAGGGRAAGWSGRAPLAGSGGSRSPYRRWLLAFLLLTVVGAGIGVATPVLAGRVVNAIVAGGQVSAAAATVLGLAGGIAALAVLEAVAGLVSRWFSSRIRERA